jgi:CRP-like cAMP-binding protein
MQADKIARLSHHLKIIALKSINERVYWALERYSSTDEDLSITSRATHKELANLIGCARESVSRALKQLKD